MKPRLLTKLSVAVVLIMCATLCCAQSENTATNEKADQIVRRGLQVVGGDRYLQIKTVVGHGLFTDFKDGVSQIPIKFVDYISYPDKERTEFTGGGVHTIQTNYRDGGWIFDGAAKTLKDQTAPQLEDFKISMRTSIENLLHGWWRADGAQLSYLGRREAGIIGRRNETVRLSYADGFWIEYEFSADDGLPAKVLYQRKQKNRDTEEIETITEEDRLHKPITIEGVTVPFIIDHYRNGVQTSRIAYDSVEYNQPITDSFFAKPSSIKGIK